jgi:hypothetical protein
MPVALRNVGFDFDHLSSARARNPRHRSFGWE